ncbi:MAG: hypothetical protein IK079_00750, partial [Desulfovibrio sp.]|nr:hypothetical protein [Desulfovibrio sp.]
SFLGCSAVQVGLTKKDLDVQTKMSDSIFLDMDNDLPRTVFLSVRDTSGRGLSLAWACEQSIAAKGYEFAPSAREATYVLQINILSLEKTDRAAADKMLGLGYAGSIGTGVLTGALIGSATHSSYGMTTGAAVGALAGGLGELVVDSVVKDVTYALVCDVRLTERLQGGQKEVHTTRVVSTANQVNLTFERARPPLEEAVAASLAGLL